MRYTEDTKEVKVNNYFYKIPLVSAWNPAFADACGIQDDGSSGAIADNVALGALGIDFGKASGMNEFNTSYNDACFTGGVTGDHANTVGQRVGVSPGLAAPNPVNGSQGLRTYLHMQTIRCRCFAVKSFTNTTGRFVWDYQINDDTLFMRVIPTGFKGRF